MTTRTRQPAGQPTGGQFAQTRRGAASVSLHTPQRMIPEDYEVNEHFPIPQANDLDKIVCVVDAVEEGANTADAIAESLNLHPREGAYYANAAGYLGLVDTVAEEEGQAFSSTALGQQMFNAEDADRAEIMSQMMAHVPGVAIYDAEGDHGVEKFYNLEGLNENTAGRRAATIKSWVNQISDPGALAGAVRHSHEEVIHRATAAAEKAAQKRAEARTRKVERINPVCPECFMQLPNSGACGCGYEAQSAAA